MKRVGRLWETLASFENLLLAFKKARKGKRRRPDVARFEFMLERELLELQADLLSGDYRPAPYRLFTVYERRPRQIAAASFRDRVVHHALLNVVEPWLDRRFIDDTYACRRGRGVHKAVDRFQQWTHRHAYVMKLDIASYFHSIDHNVLKNQLRRHIKDEKVLSLFDVIIDGSPEGGSASPVYFPDDDLFSPIDRRKGIPIGNLTSQFLGNLYLNEVDHFIKQELRASGYLRYVDDLFLLSDSKQQLHEWRQQIEYQLTLLRLRINPRKIQLHPVCNGTDVLGYRVYPRFRLLRNENGHRFLRRLRKFSVAYAKGELQWADFNPSVQSWIGHAAQADTEGLRASIFNSIVFIRESG